MNDKLYLLGCGGHAVVILETAQALDMKLAGILDPRCPIGDTILGVTVVGNDSILDGSEFERISLLMGVGANPDTQKRKEIYRRFTMRGYRFKSVVHPSSVVSTSLNAGDGLAIMANAVVQARTEIGENVVINSGAIIEHDCRIGDHSFVASGAVLCGDVAIGDAAFIGAGAKLIPGVSVGDNAIIGAGAVVINDVEAETVVKGIPARLI